MKKMWIVLSLLSFGALVAVDQPKINNGKNGPASVKVDMTKASHPFLEAIKEKKELSTFIKAFLASGAASSLQRGETYTFFIPTDEAFQKLPPQMLEDLMKPENKEKLKALVLMHIVKKKLTSKDIKSGVEVNLIGQNLDFFVRGAAISVDGANLIQYDQMGPNSVFHEVDMVILPDAANGNAKDKKPLDKPMGNK